jgi:hypothetical protein
MAAKAVLMGVLPNISSGNTGMMHSFDAVHLTFKQENVSKNYLTAIDSCRCMNSNPSRLGALGSLGLFVSRN